MNERETTTNYDVSDPLTYDDPDGVTVSVDCASCGQQIEKQDAKRFVMGNVRSHSTSGMKREYVFHKGSVNEGWVCDFCQTEGPAGVEVEVSSDFILGPIGRVAIFLLAMYGFGTLLHVALGLGSVPL